MDAELPVERSRQRSPIYRERLRVVSCRALFDVALEFARARGAPRRSWTARSSRLAGAG